MSLIRSLTVVILFAQPALMLWLLVLTHWMKLLGHLNVWLKPLTKKDKNTEVSFKKCLVSPTELSIGL